MEALKDIIILTPNY